MSRSSRTRRAAALLALAALLLPASAVRGAPVATKSGALVNYVSTAKLKPAKKMYIYFVCSADCNVQATTTIKGPRTHLTMSVSGPTVAFVDESFVLLEPSKGVLKRMKATPGKFKLANTINATDQATGATDSISHTFRLKR